jgi:hypothetical protein
MTASGENSARLLRVFVQILILLEPATTGAPAAAPPSPRIECKVVQYQCDYLHPCNIFTIRVISVLIPPGVLLLPAWSVPLII